jgi:hypothetical protein
MALFLALSSIQKKGKEISDCLVHEFASQQSKGLARKREIMERAYFILIGFNGSITKKTRKSFDQTCCMFGWCVVSKRKERERNNNFVPRVAEWIWFAYT